MSGRSPMMSIKRIFKMFTLRLAVFSPGLAVDTQVCSQCGPFKHNPSLSSLPGSPKIVESHLDFFTF